MDETAPPFEALLALRAEEMDALLREILSDRPSDGELARPKGLLAAMRHGVLNGGKRLRPFLLVETACLFDAGHHAALRVAAALECVHCYSLIHDDLPAMDDDDYRRGQPTVHRAFSEADAILAGDSLLTYAFDIITDHKTQLSPIVQVELVKKLARAAGLGGMAGGQSLDLQAEQTPPDEQGIILLQAMKTGALIRFACEAGALIGGADERQREHLVQFGEIIGLAFQLADDLLDITSSAEQMGKATGKDAAAGKATLVAMHGEDWARKQLAGLVDQAEQLLMPFGEKAAVLRLAARFVADREH
ncbi:polyprenyl synthetase family protein [Nitratireductor sp. CH_MIT9313-5]|jgi:farnesyl diphosphate synthase|uniref:polyprenyl synthetase family protein n=1 Tax=Nitratireductor sp. CH_MIT9313-5 TaxID=3107764 RepID=UPI00300B82A2